MGVSTKNYPLNSRIVRSAAIGFAATGTTIPVIDVPAGTLVLKCWLVITTLFAGGSPLLDVGDGADTDGWIDQVDITATGTGTYGASETNTAAYSDDGKYYSAADTIDVVLSASLTAGKAYLFAEMVDVVDVISD
jgi:hypothetical protein